MGKYGELIKEAKAEPAPELENQNDGNLVNQTARKPANQKTRKMDNQITRKPESQIDGEMVNLGVKVPLTWRRHWAAEAKRKGIPMTEIIIAALIAEFGKPE
jgi:capsular polysaccharide biosynthesis protein